MFRAFFLREIIFQTRPARLVWLAAVPAVTAAVTLFLISDIHLGMYASRGVLAMFAAASVLASLDNDRKNSLIGLLTGRRRMISLLSVKIICSQGGPLLFVLLAFVSGYSGVFRWEPAFPGTVGVIYTSLVTAVTVTCVYCLSHRTLYSISAAFVFLLSGFLGAAASTGGLLAAKGNLAANGLIFLGSLYSARVGQYNTVLYMVLWMAAGAAALAVLSERFPEKEKL